MDALYVVVASLMRLMERTLARFRADLAKLANLGPDREEAGPRGLRPRGQWCESLRSFPKQFNHPPAPFWVSGQYRFTNAGSARARPLGV